MLGRIVSAAVASAAALLGACGGGDNALQVSVNSLSFNSTSLYAEPPPQQVVVTFDEALHLYLNYPAGFRSSSFENLSSTETRIWIRARDGASAGGVGTHTGDLVIKACRESVECERPVATQKIRLTHSVSGIGVAAGGFGTGSSIYAIDTKLLADTNTTVTVYSSGPWTATSSLSQLTVTPSSGDAPSTQVTLALTEAAINQMQLRTGNHQATVTFSNATGQHVQPVIIAMMWPQLLAAGPRVVPAGEPQTIFLSGDYPGAYQRGTFRFGTVPATNPVGSWLHVAQADAPPLAPGTYPVSIIGSTGAVVPRSLASIAVVAPLGAAAVALGYPDARARRVTDLHFDAERSALVLGVQYPAVGESATEILRYTYAGSWSAPVARSLPFLSSLALRADGLGWMATALANGGADNTMVLCAPDMTTCQVALTLPATTRRWTQIGVNNSERPIVVAAAHPDPAASGDLMAYSVLDNTMTRLDFNVVNDGVVATSANGELVVAGSRAIARPLYAASSRGNAGGTNLGVNLLEQVRRIAIDRDGKRMLVNGRHVIDVVARLERAPLPATTLAATLNRAGTRAYTYDADGLIHAFDISTGQAAGAYPEVGSPIIPAGNPGAGTGGQDMQITLSPDGKTLFLAGASAVVVQPLS